MPLATTIVEDLDGKHSSSANSALLVTIWELGEAAGPLLIAPLSELLGRSPVFHAFTASCKNLSNVTFTARPFFPLQSTHRPNEYMVIQME